MNDDRTLWRIFADSFCEAFRKSFWAGMRKLPWIALSALLFMLSLKANHLGGIAFGFLAGLLGCAAGAVVGRKVL